MVAEPQKLAIGDCVMFQLPHVTTPQYGCVVSVDERTVCVSFSSSLYWVPVGSVVKI